MVGFKVLGPLMVEDDEGRPLPVHAVRQRRLLAALLVDAGRVVSTDRLVDAVWNGGAPPQDPLGALRTYVSRLRRVLDPDGRSSPGAIVSEPTGYRLLTDNAVTDADQFQALVSQGRALSRAGDHRRAVRLFDQALGLWRGPAFADFAEEDWVRADAVGLEELRLAAWEDRIDACLAAGEHEDLVPQLERQVTLHPLRERLRRQLMTALHHDGRTAEALDVYRDLRSRLVEELGVEPSAEIAALHTRLLRGEPIADGPPPAPPAGTASTVPQFRTSFVGRADDLDTLEEMLSRHRLVTLVGVGGSGKTRLAVELAHRTSAQYDDAVVFVDLSALADGKLLARHVADAVGLTRTPGIAPDEAEQQLLHFLGPQRALLILDNCEHIIDACAEHVDRLLDRCRRLVVLATSREPLDLDGEQLLPVGPLEVPDQSDDPATASVRLLVDRAREVRPGFIAGEDDRAPLSEICRRLDGLPLALELAAARLSHLTPQEVAERLDDRFRLLTGGRRRPTRQQTLQAAIDWSYDLLSEPERALLRVLSSFAGGATIDAVTSVSAGTVDSIQVLDLLGSLVRRSLVVAEGVGTTTRYRLLETIRLYAQGELAAGAEKVSIAEAHRDHFLSWLEAYPRDLLLTSPVVAREIEVEHDNIRLALESAHRAARYDLIARFVTALTGFFLARGYTDEFDRWMGVLGSAALTPATRAELVVHASYVDAWRFSGDLARYRAMAARLTAALDELPGERLATAVAHCVFAAVSSATELGSPEIMMRHGESADRLAASLGATQLRAFAMAWRAAGHLYRHEYAEAVRMLEAACGLPGWRAEHDGQYISVDLAVARHLVGDQEGAARAASVVAEMRTSVFRYLGLLADAMARAGAGDVDAARRGVREAVEAIHEARWTHPLAYHNCLVAMGGTALTTGDHEIAARLLAGTQNGRVGAASIYAVYLHYRERLRALLPSDVRKRCISEGAATPAQHLVDGELRRWQVALVGG
jgi:predicted ATPase/DNA-binding SARP family transcriptional activator